MSWAGHLLGMKALQYLDKLHEAGVELERLHKQNQELKQRLRTTCQTLVEVVGANGPCDAEYAAERAAKQIQALERELHKWTSRTWNRQTMRSEPMK